MARIKTSERDQRPPTNNDSAKDVRHVSSVVRRGAAAAIAVTPGESVTVKGKTGALIGSFDNFESSFVVGESTSMQVPQGASTLALAINDDGAASGPAEDRDSVVEVTIGKKKGRRS